MFERYTDAARRALFFARYDSSELGATFIDTEHILLGLLRVDGDALPAVLAGASQSALRQDLIEHALHRPKMPTSVEIPFSEAAKRALNAAAEEADALGHADIGPEHLVLGLLREPESAAGAALTRHGVTIGRVRDALNAQQPGLPQGIDVNATLDRLADRTARLAQMAGGSNVELQMAAHQMMVATLEDIERLRTALKK